MERGLWNSKQVPWAKVLHRLCITDDFGLKVGIVKVDEMHDDVVEGDETGEYGEYSWQYEPIVIKIAHAIPITGDYAVLRVGS